MTSSSPHIVFVIGSGRSGTTALYQQICANLQFGYIPSIAGVYPRSLPMAGYCSRFFNSRLLTPSNESVGIFERFGLGHSRVRQFGRPLTRDDVDNALARDFRVALARLAKAQNKPCIVIKNTGATARIAAIATAVPNSSFIHIVRDGRAVAASLSKVGFFPQLPLWWSDSQPAQELVSEYGSLALVAAEHWSQQINASKNALSNLPKCRWIELSYETFTENPMGVLESIVSKIPSVQWRPKDERWPIEPIRTSSINRWQKDLNKFEIDTINDKYENLIEKWN